MSQIKIGLIGGSGLGEAMAARTDGRRHEVDTPFGPPSDAFVETDWGGLPVFFLARHGAGHRFGPSQVPYRANIFALKTLGVTHIIASGAVGSLREEFRPRDLVIPDQIIDKTSKRAGTFYENAAVHVEFAEPFCNVLRRLLMEEGSGFTVQGSGETANDRATGASAKADPTQSTLNLEPRTQNPPHAVHDRGCYVCMEGPAFSTRAESVMHRLWGGDLIGMTAMPEAKLAREAEMAYALVALVTDYDCWRKPPSAKAGAPVPDAAELLQEIIANLRAASDNGIALIRRAIERIAANPDALGASSAHSALKLAIWSDRARIPRDEIDRLAPLWKKYFEAAG
jgi:5'-methylthioadenosine phosphorylase